MIDSTIPLNHPLAVVAILGLVLCFVYLIIKGKKAEPTEEIEASNKRLADTIEEAVTSLKLMNQQITYHAEASKAASDLILYEVRSIKQRGLHV